MVNFDWSSLIIASGIINGLIAIVLYKYQNKEDDSLFFWFVSVNVSIILILSERVARFSELIDTYPFLLFISSPIFFILLPLLYCYQRKLIGSKTNWYLHSIIPVLFFLLLIPTFVLDGQEKLLMYHNPKINDPPFIIVFYIMYALTYIFSIYRLNKKHKKALFDNLTDPNIHNQLFSNKVIFICSLMTLILPFEFTFQYTSLNPKTTLLIAKWLFILLSISLHLILVSVFLSSEQQLKKQAKVKSIAELNVAAEDLTELKKVLTNYIESHKPYLENDLTLQMLADKLNWGRSSLSQLINSGFQKNFYTYINEYRIKEICNKLDDGAHKKYSLEHLALDNGFKSYVSFYRTFKKLKNKTPKEYIKLLA